MKLVPYSEYRDSGVPWLRRIPAHWEVRKLKFSSKMIAGGATPASGESELWDGDIVWVTPQDVSKNERLNSSSRNLTSAGVASCSAVLVPPGSIVITSRAPVGNVSFAEVELCTNQGCKAFVPDERYLLNEYSLILLKAMQPVFQKAANGTTFLEISAWAFENIKTPLPPLEEQTQIARFLDSKTAQIDKFIRNKQRLIQLLKEQKQNVINQAVTRGLDPNVKLKPSGVEWLGDIPEHWEVRKLKFSSKMIAGGATPASGESALWDGDIVWVTPQDVSKNERLNSSSRNLTSAGVASCSAVLVPPGSIVITSRAPVGNVSFAEVELCTNQGCKAFVPDERYLLNEYSLILLKAMQPVFQKAANGTTFLEISTWAFENIKTPLPPLEEQQAIIAHIQKQSDEIDRVATRAQREIDLMHEYRARLISDVVTGQVDVRGMRA